MQEAFFFFSLEWFRVEIMIKLELPPYVCVNLPKEGGGGELT